MTENGVARSPRAFPWLQLAGLAVAAVLVVVAVFAFRGDQGSGSHGTAVNTNSASGNSGLSNTIPDGTVPGNTTAPVQPPAGTEGLGAPYTPAQPPPVIPAELRAELAMFTDTTIPLEQRQKAVMDLARKEDAHSADLLMALGDAQVYLNAKAVEALAWCPDPRVPNYLKAKLNSQDFTIAVAAIRAYARSQEAQAVPDLLAAIQRNRVRPDGYEQQVCSEAVQALGRMGPDAAGAVPGLAGELGRCGEKGWNLEYGSVLVTALGNIGSAEAKKAIGKYADALSGTVPEEAMQKKYYQDRIAEARAAAAGQINQELLGTQEP